MKCHYKLLMDQVIKISLAIVTCITTLLLLSSSSYADTGKDFLSKDERKWLAENQSQITRAVETGYAPFVFIDSKDRPVGLANDYMLLLESKLGVHFKEKRFSKLNEIFDKLKSGEVHIVNAVTNSPARSKFITFTAPFISVPNVIIVQNNRTGSFKEETLKGLKVSLVKEYAVTEHFTNKGLSFTPYLVPDDITALYNVSSGHTDAAIIDLATASYLISTKGITNLRIAGETTFAIQLAMGTPVAQPMLNSIIQKGLAQITEAERKEIRSRWINVSRENFFADWRFWAVVIVALSALCAAIFGNFLWNRALRHQVLLRTEELARETEALQELKEELQVQNEELAANEEELRLQNDQLIDTEEMLRIKICDHENSLKLLHDSEERLRLVSDNMESVIFLISEDKSKILYISPSYEKVTGRTCKSIYDRLESFMEPVHPEDLHAVKTEFEKFLNSGCFDLEYRIIKPDGEVRWLDLLAYPTKDDAALTVKYSGIATDITERKQSEEALREQSKRHAALIDGFPYPVLLIGKDRTIIASNKVAQDMGVVPGSHCWREFGRSAAIPAAAKKYLEEHGSPPPEGTHCWFCRADASLTEQNLQNDPTVESNGRFYDTYWSPLNDETYLHYAIDVTERKQAEAERHLLEQQFQQTQKLESLGVLAGGIAHDFNNILAIIIGYCSLTKMDYENSEANITEIEKAAERAAALCRQMLAYAGKATLTQSQVNTWMLVDEMVSMLKTTIPQNVVINPELGTDVPFILGDASQLRQVVMNLIINAAEAIGDDQGVIDVKLAKVEISAEQPEQDHLGVIIPAGRYICFEVTDNGCGMDEETRGKIFEPFYTTKFTGRGLGMSAVIGIIKAHNGSLKLESQLGQGTTFRVYLPVQLSKSETEEAEQITASTPWQGSGTVLLAEDELRVKTIAIALLQKLGFTVIDAANGKEALELYQQNAADITLVVTDMGMPTMNGYELFYKLKQLNPQLPIIISSGFGEGDIASKIPRDHIAGMINKPYTFDQLREVLRGVVESP